MSQWESVTAAAGIELLWLIIRPNSNIYARTVLAYISIGRRRFLLDPLPFWKAPLHDTIRPHGACRFPCTWVNRNVWHVGRMSRTRENRVKMNYSLFYFRADSAARAVRLPNQSAADTKNDLHLIQFERETGSV